MNSPHTLAPKGAVANPLAVVVVEGGARVGFGHVGRCLALWEELGGRVVFSAEDSDVMRVLTTLGATLATSETWAPVVVIDRATATGVTEVAHLQAQGQRVCLLDDPGPGRSVADLVVDPPTGVSWPAAGGRRLSGFPHVLLRREIREAAGQGGESADVLLSLGGSDPEGLTPALARALTDVGLAVHSVIGPGYRGPLPPGRVLKDPHRWPCALAQAGLLLGRFGHTLLEAAYLGTPALALAMDAQATTEAAALAAHGTSEAIVVSGPSDAPRVAGRALTLSGEPGRLAAMAARGRDLVDGLGAARVAAALLELT
jgi:UDP-2,4-diacetamido-2,4,6-trideoxy-beta-L-altropyranose hydrolase